MLGCFAIVVVDRLLELELSLSCLCLLCPPGLFFSGGKKTVEDIRVTPTARARRPAILHPDDV